MHRRIDPLQSALKQLSQLTVYVWAEVVPNVKVARFTISMKQ
jgi:hypothetical protein